MGRSDPNSQIDLAHLGDLGAPSPPRARYLPPPPNQRLSGMAQLTGGLWEAGLCSGTALGARDRARRHLGQFGTYA